MTPWHPDWTKRARKGIRRLDVETARRAGNAVDRLAATGQGDVKKLSAVDPPEWRLRVGSGELAGELFVEG